MQARPHKKDRSPGQGQRRLQGMAAAVVATVASGEEELGRNRVAQAGEASAGMAVHTTVAPTDVYFIATLVGGLIILYLLCRLVEGEKESREAKEQNRRKGARPLRLNRMWPKLLRKLADELERLQQEDDEESRKETLLPHAEQRLSTPSRLQLQVPWLPLGATK